MMKRIGYSCRKIDVPDDTIFTVFYFWFTVVENLSVATIFTEMVVVWLKTL
jgi:hypothetical protein